LKYQAEYIWIDGSEPTRKLRSKTKIVTVDRSPRVGLRRSSTNQATGHFSDCVLLPAFTVPDHCAVPMTSRDVRSPERRLYAHVTNERAATAAVAKKYASFEPKFGIEQEYTFFQDGRPYGWPEDGFPRRRVRTTAVSVVRRCPVETSSKPTRWPASAPASALRGRTPNHDGQWEFQVGVLGPVEVGDQLWLARWLLERIAEEFGVDVSFDAKPVKGDWNGAGAHTNFSTKQMRAAGGYGAVIAGPKRSGPASKSTSPTMESASRSVSPELTRLRTGRSSPTACRTGRVNPYSRTGRAREEGLPRRPSSQRQRRPLRRRPTDHRDGVRRRERQEDAAKKVAAKKTPAKQAAARSSREEGGCSTLRT